MKKYYWNIEYINKKIKTLYNMLKYERDLQKRYIIKSDITNLQNFLKFIKTSNQTPSLLESYNIRKEDLKRLGFFWQYYEMFFNIASQTSIPCPPKISSFSLTEDDILDITHDFYKTLNSFFFQNFMRNYKMRKNHLNFDFPYLKCFMGFTTSINSLQENFIIVHRQDNIEDIITTIHEYMHAICSNLNPYYSEKIFVEIETLFIELVAIDYLEKTLNDISPLTAKIKTYKTRVEEANDITNLINLIYYEEDFSRPFQNNSELITRASNINIKFETLKKILSANNFDDELYFTSYMLAIELYMIYKKDPDKALDILKRLITMDCLPNNIYFKRLIQLGLIPNNSFQEFSKEIKEDSLKLTKKKSA